MDDVHTLYIELLNKIGAYYISLRLNVRREVKLIIKN